MRFNHGSRFSHRSEDITPGGGEQARFQQISNWRPRLWKPTVSQPDVKDLLAASGEAGQSRIAPGELPAQHRCN